MSVLTAPLPVHTINGRAHFMNVGDVRSYLQAVGYAPASSVVIRRTKSVTKGVRAFEVAVPGPLPATGSFTWVFQVSGNAVDGPYFANTSINRGEPVDPAHQALIDQMNVLYRALYGTTGVYVKVK